MSAVFECVPNVSEGRDAQVIAACADAIAAAGALLADVSSDADHHRSVFTFFGDAETIARAAAALARVCAQRIDLRAHAGAHPRIGALDVLPVVPMRGATLAAAAEVARDCARRIWDEAAIPALYYGAASTPPGRELAELRRGGFEGLAARAAGGERPAIGEALFHPSAGAVAVGARDVLIAFNLLLRGTDVVPAQRIAATLRERGGGLRTLRALGLRAGSRIQVSCNLTDEPAVPLRRLIALVERMAARAGTPLESCERIGLMPRSAIARAVEDAFGGDGAYGTNTTSTDDEV